MIITSLNKFIYRVIKIRKVLVTDGDSRKALCVVRSLGQQGYEVIVGSNKKINMSRLSKYTSHFIQLPDPVSHEKDYINKIEEFLRNNTIDVIIPMEDETVELVLLNKKILGNTKTLLPDYETFMIARDKSKTMQKAEELGVSIPKTYHANDIKEFKSKINHIEFPVIIKPRISSGSRGISIIENKNELHAKYNEVHKEYSNPIIQQYLSGNFRKIQVLVLFDENNEIKLSCTYQGIREFPVSGGPVTLWKTISDLYIEKKTIDFLKKIKWVGFAEVEYVVDQEINEYYLMEINPRFSANINLAVQLGIDYPLYFVKLALGKDIEFIKNQKFNEYCQWLLPGDILNFIFNKDRFNQEIGYLVKKPKSIYYAILSKNDLKPILGLILSMIVYFPINIKNLFFKLKVSKKGG